MKGRIRTLTALLALFALSAYFAESVMASWCVPGADHSAGTVVEAVGPSIHAAMHHGGTHGDSPDSQNSGTNVPPCPFGMTGAGASCVAASLPAAAQFIASVPTVRSSPLLLLDQSPDLLLVTPQFRPPRA